MRPYPGTFLPIHLLAGLRLQHDIEGQQISHRTQFSSVHHLLLFFSSALLPPHEEQSRRASIRLHYFDRNPSFRHLTAQHDLDRE
jgi:hypothetical protein